MIPRRQRQWEIYRANLGENSDCYLLVLSSDETNEILDSQVIACELVMESAQKLSSSPVTIKAAPAETGLSEAAVISAATLASIPKNCLVSLEGRLEPISLRLAADRAIQILLGNERWP